MLRTLVLLLFIGALSLAAAGCDESESVRVENKTARTVVVYEDGTPTELIGPGLTEEFSTHQFRGTLTYDVRYFCDEEACDQTVLASRTFTWEEMQATGGITIVIE